MELHTEAEVEPALDVAISHALLQRAAQQGIGSLRIWRPRRAALSLGRLDMRDPGARALAEIARSAGLEPVARLAGGRAAVLDSGCLCLGWAQPAAGLQDPGGRYRFVAGAIVATLIALGVAAEVAATEGEWCPGTWSVRGPAGKLGGLAQRVIRGAAWSEALLVIERTPACKEVAERVHKVLEIPWREEAQGELRPLLAGEADVHDALATALAAQLRRRWPALRVGPLPAGLRAQALALRADHQVPQGSRNDQGPFKNW